MQASGEHGLTAHVCGASQRFGAPLVGGSGKTFAGVLTSCSAFQDSPIYYQAIQGWDFSDQAFQLCVFTSGSVFQGSPIY